VSAPAVRRRSFEFSATDQTTAKRYLLSGIPPAFWTAVRARARRDGVAVRTLILTLLRRHLDDETPPQVYAAAPDLLAAVRAAAADLDASIHGAKPPIHPIRLAAIYRVALHKAGE